MPTFMQKLTLAWRGWMRRQSSRAAEKNDAFIREASSWGPAKPDAGPTALAGKDRTRFDLEGLQVAFLDDSGRIEHYLDVESGEVIEFLGAERNDHDEVIRDKVRFRRVPTRDAASEKAERIAFLADKGSEPLREPLRRCVASAADFRRALARDRRVEKAWYNFRNDAATRAIETWLRSI